MMAFGIGNILQSPPYPFSDIMSATNQQMASRSYHGQLNAYPFTAKHKLMKAHEIAADVRARHPEMQVKRLGNDCAARSD